MVVVVVVVVAVLLVYVLVLYFLARSRPQKIASAASSSTVICLRFRGCPVLSHIEFSVSARCHKTRVLPRARRLLLASAASGSMRHRFQNYMQSECGKITILGQSECQKIPIFFKTHYCEIASTE